jgi:spermidine synthase
LENVFDETVSLEPRVAPPTSTGAAFLRILPILFFLSGASSLIFETIFTRLLTYTFGNTAHATSTVLAAFLGGLALGAFLFGRWVDRRAPSLWIYGTLELLVGVYCIFIPNLFALLTHAYVALYHWFHLGPAALTATRFLLAAVVILIPTILMGGTLPALARVVSAGRSDFESDVSRLYAWNTLGAALGTLVSTYALMPHLGVRGTIGLACSINFVIFIAAAVLASRRSPASPVQQDVPPEPAIYQAFAPRLVTVVLLLGALLTGAVALAYEVVWTHVLAFLIGNTVYAFGVMLFTFLCGLGLGAQVVAHRLRRPDSWAKALAASQILLALAIFLTLPLWNRIPDVFAQGLTKAFEFNFLSVVFLLLVRMIWVGVEIRRRMRATGFPKAAAAELAVEAVLLAALMTANTDPLWKSETTYFVTAELLRFFCAFYLLIVPAVLLGLSFPLLLNLASHGARGVGGRVGGIYAANTLGAIAGSVLTGFVVLPRWGSLASLKASASLNLLLGFAFAALLLRMTSARKLVLAAATVAVATVAWASMGNWDARRMSRGAYVYFDQGWPIDRVLYHAEDVEGGLTSVVKVGPTRILLSNGKFQGNNSGEVGAQVRFAMIPILFTKEFDRALVIGLGTGSTLRTVASFPFRRIDTVEIAPHVVEAARQWFEDVNGRVFDRDPRVHLTIADGRNFLLLSRQRYDLITIEISSIWISGEADLYNKEFYELCRAHLKEHGVLQQWVQIHHMRTEDFLVILNTAVHVFPHVAFFLGPEQGVLIASEAPLECDYRQLEKYDREPTVREELAALKIPSTFGLLGEMMLYGDSMRQALAQLPRFSGRPASFVSTDFRPYLEYQTPKGNSLPQTTVYDNLNFMLSLRPADPLPSDFPIINVPSEDERNLIRGYAATHRGDLQAAVEYFRRVGGAERSRAQEEIGLIEAGARSIERHR